ncbi:MAG: lipase family protein [Symploca sp. SIO1C2]|nr:lipase family protein [Symploca sp. SIO1C2]
MKISTKLLLLCLALVLSLTTVMTSLAMANEELDQVRQIYLLSGLSNGVYDIRVNDPEVPSGGFDELLRDKVETALDDEYIQDYIGEWNLVWGPVVDNTPLQTLSKTPKELPYASNSMYVAQKDNQYVVSIAASNGKSLFDSMVEDSFVGRQIDWEYADEFPEELDPKIAGGTLIGLNILLNMNSPGQGKLLDFLGEAVQGPNDEVPEIIFTGISLGGALSPVLALAALDSQDTWAHGNPFNIYVEPIAGQTPGNEDFSTYYDISLGNNTTRIWNSIDIIPHLWNEEMLDEIPSLYEPEIGATGLIQTLVEGAKSRARGGNYTQLMPDTLPLEGTVMQPIPSICGEKSTSINPSPLTETKAFMEQADYQHILAYAELLDVVAPYCYLVDIGSLPDMETTSIKLSTAPISNGSVASINTVNQETGIE